MTILQLEEFKRETLIGYVENLTVPFESKTLPFLPRDKDVYSLSFAYDIFKKHNNVAANLLEFGAPAPLRDKQGLERAVAEVAKLAHRYRFDQKDQLTIMNTKFDKERQQVIDRVFNYIDNLKLGVEETEEYFRTSVLYKGRIKYNLDGFTLDLAFDVPKAFSAAIKWSDVEKSNPIKDLVDWIEKFKKANAGRRPLAIHMSNAAYLDILQSKSTISNIKGVAGGMVTPDELATYLKRWNIPPITTNDLEITFEDGKTERYLPERRVVFLGIEGKQTLGSTVQGPTVEKNGQPGIYTRTWNEENTLNEFVEIGKAAFPELSYPSGVMQIDV
ncbi:major capsid protein [Bacillus cytotoxicus]|uniref:major capsid protein n=1 Tax=unclassified Bacillus cereus group TaxID=2750818 RepID=UPI001F59AD15|nr:MULTISPECIES: major capsid protein [unclassified Bacillus cereus group]EMA6344877.1 major capsid protein [Bacillus cytotoxicus]